MAALDTSGPWLTRARVRRTRLQLGQRAIALLRIDHEDGLGRLFDWTLVPVSLAFTDRKRPGLKQLRSWWHSVGPDLQSAAEGAARRAGIRQALLSGVSRVSGWQATTEWCTRAAARSVDRRTERIHLPMTPLPENHSTKSPVDCGFSNEAETSGTRAAVRDGALTCRRDRWSSRV